MTFVSIKSKNSASGLFIKVQSEMGNQKWHMNARFKEDDNKCFGT